MTAIAHVKQTAVQQQQSTLMRRHTQTRQDQLQRIFKQIDFDAHGYTEGCPGCRGLQEEGRARQGHNQICRPRIEDLISQTAAGKARVEEGDARVAAASMREFEMKQRRGQAANASTARGSNDPAPASTAPPTVEMELEVAEDPEAKRRRQDNDESPPPPSTAAPSVPEPTPAPRPAKRSANRSSRTASSASTRSR